MNIGLHVSVILTVGQQMENGWKLHNLHFYFQNANILRKIASVCVKTHVLGTHLEGNKYQMLKTCRFLNVLRVEKGISKYLQTLLVFGINRKRGPSQKL